MQRLWLLAVMVGCATPTLSDRPLGPAPQVAPLPAPFRRYVVGPGDSLSLISTRYGVPGGALRLATLNHLASRSVIHPGQELRIPASSPFTDDLPLAPPAPEPAPVLEACGRQEVSIEWPHDAQGALRCAYLRPETRVCQRLLDDEAFVVEYRDAGRDAVALLQGTAQWPWLGSIRVLSGPLGVDGSERLVVSRLSAVSNGLNHRTHDVAVLDPASGDVSTFEALDIDGIEPAVFLARQGDACTLAVRAEETQGAADRGYGNYFVTRFYRADGADLRAVPALHRLRLAPDATVESLATEWLEQGRSRRLRVRVVRVTEDGMVLRRADGRRIDHHYFTGTPLPLERTHPLVDAVGDAYTRRLYPNAYRRSNDDWLSGRGGVVAEYDLPGLSRGRRVLWLDPAP